MTPSDIDVVSQWLLALVLGMSRIIGAFALLPLYSGRISSLVLRLGFAAACTIPVIPYLQDVIKVNAVEEPIWALLVVKEAFIGLILGAGIVVPFWVAEAVGAAIDNQRGATIAGSMNLLSGNEGSPLADFLSQAYMISFLTLGGITLTLKTVYSSYAVWAVTAPFPSFSPGFSSFALGLLEDVSQTAVLLAAPVMVAMLLAELSLAIVSLFAPQMQVFFLAMPIKSGIALFVLIIYLSTLISYLEREFVGMHTILQRLAEFMK